METRNENPAKRVCRLAGTLAGSAVVSRVLSLNDHLSARGVTAVV